MLRLIYLINCLSKDSSVETELFIKECWLGWGWLLKPLVCSALLTKVCSSYWLPDSRREGEQGREREGMLITHLEATTGNLRVTSLLTSTRHQAGQDKYDSDLSLLSSTLLSAQYIININPLHQHHLLAGLTEAGIHYMYRHQIHYTMPPMPYVEANI